MNSSAFVCDPDIVFAADPPWWRAYRGRVTREAWTTHEQAAKDHGLNWMPTRKGFGLSDVEGVVSRGGLSSGEYAIHLAHQFGFGRVILLGYDCQETGGRRHHHGDHPGKLNRSHDYARWMTGFRALAQQKELPIINATRETALTMFPRMTIREAIDVCHCD